ncbi:MAG: hypothetical protein EXR75_16255 [Myxococcales bacterium]|nr:hypothetical protein [Myxococcales bacterium]
MSTPMEPTPRLDAPTENETETATEFETETDEAAADPKWWEDLRDFYFASDRRVLGLTRILLGFFLIFDLFRRTPDWATMYSNDGVLPTHVNLWRPQSNGWSVFNAFATRPELWALWAFGLVVFFCLMIGYKTKVMQILAAIYVASMNGRVLLIENGGYVVHNLLLLWTAFLPLGDRFSVDAMRASFRANRESSAAALNDRSCDTAAWRLRPHTSFAALVILLQLAAIYGFNVMHKTGPAWHDGTAVHYVLWVDRMVTPLIGITREHLPPWLLIILTKSVMGMEAGLPLALLSPLARVWSRRAALLFMVLLHVGFGSTFVLGPFAWALCIFSVLLLSREDFELMNRTMRRVHRARALHFDPRDGAALFACRLLKRMDKWQLLTFVADESARGLTVMVPSHRGSPVARKTGVVALYHAIAALPGGPIFAWLAPLVFVAQHLVIACFRFRAATLAPATAPRSELEDDALHPRIDAYFMGDWLSAYHKTRVLGRTRMWLFGAVLLVLGLFLFVYGVPLARKASLDLSRRLLGGDAAAGGLTRERIIVVVGGALAVIGAYNFFKPFVVMNLTTAALPARKWQRTLATLREVFCVVMFCGAVNQALVELWVTRTLGAPQPNEVRILSHKFRYLQGWFMFSPNPVMDDGTIVTDCITIDGRRIDPFSPNALGTPVAIAPDFDLLHSKSFGYNQIWSDYYNRMHLPQNSAFRNAMKDYIFRLPRRSGNPNDAIVKGAVYWVHDMNPRFRRIGSYAYDRQELFQFTNPDATVQAQYQSFLASGGADPPEAPLPVPLPKKEEPKKEEPKKEEPKKEEPKGIERPNNDEAPKRGERPKTDEPPKL